MLGRHQLRMRQEQGHAQRVERRREEEEQRTDRKDAPGWMRIKSYLEWQELLEERRKKELRAERRVTVFHGVRTSWPRIEHYARYVLVNAPGGQWKRAA